MGRVGAELRGFLERRDPQGYYVIPAKPEAAALLGGWPGVEVERAGGLLLVRVKSRGLALRILRALAGRGLLARP